MTKNCLRKPLFQSNFYCASVGHFTVFDKKEQMLLIKQIVPNMNTPGGNAMTFFKPILTTVAVFFSLTLLSQNVYLKNTSPIIKTDFDRFLYELWKKEKIAPAREASDCVMVRRVYIDLLGRVPSPEEARSYINSNDPDKQAQLVEKLLSSEEYAMFMTMRLGDELRIKSEFPINLWPNAAFLYTNTIYNALRNDMPFDSFAEALILSDGSNFRNGCANFFRAVPQKQPAEIADAAAKFLLGKSLKQLS